MTDLPATGTYPPNGALKFDAGRAAIIQVRSVSIVGKACRRAQFGVRGGVHSGLDVPADAIPIAAAVTVYNAATQSGELKR
jgi:hypothetical protein